VLNTTNHHPNLPSNSELPQDSTLSMVTSTMLNSNMTMVLSLEKNPFLERKLLESNIQIFSKILRNQMLSKPREKLILIGDQFNSTNGMVPMMELSIGPPTVGPDKPIENNQSKNYSDLPSIRNQSVILNISEIDQLSVSSTTTKKNRNLSSILTTMDSNQKMMSSLNLTKSSPPDY